MDKKLYSILDIAEILYCSKSKVERLVYSGELPSSKYNKLRRVKKEDLDDYIKAIEVD